MRRRLVLVAVPGQVGKPGCRWRPSEKPVDPKLWFMVIEPELGVSSRNRVKEDSPRAVWRRGKPEWPW